MLNRINVMEYKPSFGVVRATTKDPKMGINMDLGTEWFVEYVSPNIAYCSYIGSEEASIAEQELEEMINDSPGGYFLANYIPTGSAEEKRQRLTDAKGGTEVGTIFETTHHQGKVH